MIYRIGQINVCTDFEINRYRIDEVRKYAKIVCLFDVTWRKNGTSYVMGTPALLIGILTRNILKLEVFTTSGSKVMAQIVVFVFSVTLTLTFVLFFVTRIAHDVLEYPCEVS